MSKNFIVNGIISANCFKEENQIDINVSITPKNKFLDLLNIELESEAELIQDLFKDDILESISLLFSLNLKNNKTLSKSSIDYVQLEVFSSYNEDYNLILDSIISKEEIDCVKKYLCDFLIERQKQSKLWDDYLG